MALTKIGKEGITGIDNSSNATAITIDSSENIGIGLTSNIDRKLHVEVDNTYAAKFGGTAGGDFAIEIGQTGTNGSAGFNATGTSGAMKFSISGTEAMRIDPNRNVGIGTSSPTHALTVQYNAQTTTAKFQNTNTSGTGIDSAQVRIESSSRDASLVIVSESSRSSFIDFGDEVSSTRGRILYAHSDDSMQILTAATERMRITDGGNVGIGTSSPTFAAGGGLQVKGSSFTSVRVSSGGNTGIDFSQTTSGASYLYNRDNADLIFGTNDTERMRIDSSGRLQVGLTNGESGINTLSGLSWYRTNLYNQRWNAFISHGGTGEYGSLYFNGTLTTGDFVVQPGETERMKLKYNGETYFTGVYAQTTSSGANVHVLSNGFLRRSTSSLRYKNTINDATHGLNELLTLRPVTYKGNNDGDTVFGGLIAEEVHDAGLTEFVQYDDDGQPDALAYGNMVSLCIKAIQELKAELDEAKARIVTLENA
jgi:hypothetical protein